MTDLGVHDRFALSFDLQARHWLSEHQDASRLYIAFMSSRACCSGTQVCDVRVRVEATTSQPAIRGASWIKLGSVQGREVMLDSRLADRMPSQIRFIQRGVGPFRRLDLHFSSEQWADMLYPTAR
ncbi:MAG: hypothetical protein ACHQ4F_09625 [Candidatus Dormibacteria bacterium]